MPTLTSLRIENMFQIKKLTLDTPRLWRVGGEADCLSIRTDRSKKIEEPDLSFRSQCSIGTLRSKEAIRPDRSEDLPWWLPAEWSTGSGD